jgi:hypothetical protein
VSLKDSVSAVVPLTHPQSRPFLKALSVVHSAVPPAEPTGMVVVAEILGSFRNFTISRCTGSPGPAAGTGIPGPPTTATYWVGLLSAP